MMDTSTLELPFLSNIGLMLTYKCPLACPHCIVKAGPHRTEEMSLTQTLAWIDQAKAYRDGHIKGLALTGGEPFYNMKNLAAISMHGQELGFIISVVTSAYWATTKETALSVLEAVPAVQMISISTDIYHQKSIPFAYVNNAVWAAKKLGRLYNIAVCTDNEENPGYQQIIADITAMGEADKLRRSVVFPAGRANRKARYFRYQTAPEPTVSACSMASSPVIFPDGKVMACIGPLLTLAVDHPLVLGNLQHESLATVLDRAEVNPILHMIRVWGPYKLVSLLQQRGFGALLPEEYICNSICDVCYQLMTNEQLVRALHQLADDEEIQKLVAYARLYYLHEPTMVEFCTANHVMPQQL